MSLHEKKYCPRCNAIFVCKPGNIAQCQCYGIGFTAEERQRLDMHYDDCLCRNCLDALKNEFSVQLKQLPLPKK